MKGRLWREEEAIFGGADRQCTESSRDEGAGQKPIPFLQLGSLTHSILEDPAVMARVGSSGTLPKAILNSLPIHNRSVVADSTGFSKVTDSSDD